MSVSVGEPLLGKGIAVCTRPCTRSQNLKRMNKTFCKFLLLDPKKMSWDLRVHSWGTTCFIALPVWVTAAAVLISQLRTQKAVSKQATFFAQRKRKAERNYSQL